MFRRCEPSCPQRTSIGPTPEARPEPRSSRSLAVALIGDLCEGENGYRDVLRALAKTRLPVFWVPGPGDAPADLYLREAYSIEVAFPLLHARTAELAELPAAARR